MGKRVLREALGFDTLKEAGLEVFEAVEVHRSELNGAPYNPRKISETQKAKLAAGLKRNGLVAPITWNIRTGNIVGGHQRIASMDALMGKDNYRLTVAKIDVDEGREKELNILLNNSQAQGDWDIGALTEMFKDDTIKVEGTGFDVGDVYQLMGESPFETRADDASKIADQLDSVKGLYDTIKQRNQSHEANDYYFVVVFRTDEQLANFFDRVGLPSTRYQNGERFAELCGIDIETADEESAPPP